MVRCFTGGLLACLIATSAFAGVTAFTAVPVTAGAGAPAGYVTTDIKVSFTGQYTGSQLLTPVLAANAIYQDAFGAASPPNAAFIGVFPSLAYDTYVAQGSATAGGAFGEPSLGGGAVDLGGAPGAVFTGTQINQAWNPAGGVNISDQSDFLIARVTLATSVNGPLGSVLALASAAGAPATISGSIVNGAIVFPSAGDPPVFNDFTDSAALNEVIATTIAKVSGTDPITLGALTNFNYTPGFGAKPNPTGIGIQPTWNPATGEFSFNTSGSTRGTYSWDVTATNAVGNDTFKISVDVPFVPEPTSMVLVGLALAGFAGFRRK